LFLKITSHFFASWYQWHQDHAIKRGYNVMIANSNESLEQEKANMQKLCIFKVDAIINFPKSRKPIIMRHLD